MKPLPEKEVEKKSARKCVIVKISDDVFTEHPSGMKPHHARVGNAYDPEVGTEFIVCYENSLSAFHTSVVIDWNPETGILKTENSTLIMTIHNLVKLAHRAAEEKGFWDGGGHNIGEKLMLIVSELGEALEALRKDKHTDPGDLPIVDHSDSTFENNFRVLVKDTFEDELADAVIRIADLAGHLRIDLEKHVELKLRYNKTRPYKHGKKF